MLFSNTRLFPLLLMLALALLTFWLERTARTDQSHPSLHRHDPDYIVNNFNMVRYGSAGNVESMLSARRMVHFPDDDSTELDSPRVVQTKPAEAPLNLSANTGALSQDGEDTFLYQNVLLVRRAIPSLPEMRIRTDFLHMVRARSLFLTDREIEIREENRFLTGRGMEYDNLSRVLQLRDRVRGRFDQRKK